MKALFGMKVTDLFHSYRVDIQFCYLKGRFCHLAYADLEFMILFPQSAECWDYRCEASCLAFYKDFTGKSESLRIVLINDVKA